MNPSEGVHLNAIFMLCEHAVVADSRLFINGAGIQTFTAVVNEPPFGIHATLAIQVAVPWTATNQKHRIEIELVYDDGTSATRIPLGTSVPGMTPEQEGKIVADFNVGRGPNAQPGMEQLMPLAIPLRLAVPGLGSYFFNLEIDGTQMSRVSFHLAPATLMLAAG
jgi:hypothetical protein